MKILFVHQHYYPELVGTGRRSTEMCEYLAKCGHDITVVTSYPKRNYHLHVYKEIREKESHNGVNIIRVKQFFMPRRNSLLRIISYLEFFIKSLLISVRLSKNTDLCISMTPLAAGITGSILHRLYGLDHHFDITDLLPDLGIVAGMLKNRFVIFIMRKIELFVYKNTDSFSVVTKSMADYLKRSIGENKKIICVPDWVDLNIFAQESGEYEKEIIERYELAGKKVILFEGNVGKLQNLYIIPEVVNVLRKQGLADFVFIIVGDGIELSELKKIVRKGKYEEIIFTGRVPREYLPSFLSISDILFSNYMDHPHLDMYIPGKIYEYISANKPIVIGARGECESLIQSNGIGFAAEPSNAESIAEAIIKTFDKEDWNIDNRKLLENLSSSYSLSKLNEFITKEYKNL